MQGEVRRARKGAARHHSLELSSRFQPLHVFRASALRVLAANPVQPPGTVKLDSQPLAALGAARVDDGAATAGFHADQKAVGPRAADFGRLVGAFHLENPVIKFRTAFDYRKFVDWRQYQALYQVLCGPCPTGTGLKMASKNLARSWSG